MLSLNDAGGRGFDGLVSLGFDAALAVNRGTQGVDDTANQALANGYGYHLAGTLYDVAFLDALVRAKDNDGNGFFFQVLCHAVGAIGEFHQLTGHALIKTGGLCDAVAHQNDDTGFTDLDLVFVVFDLTTNDFGYFFGSKFHTVPAFSSEYGVFQQLTHRVQSVGDGIVQPLPIIVQTNAAQTGGIDPVFQQNGLAGQAGQLLSQGLGLGFR